MATLQSSSNTSLKVTSFGEYHLLKCFIKTWNGISKKYSFNKIAQKIEQLSSLEKRLVDAGYYSMALTRKSLSYD